jgi:hypothetical protein
MIRVTEGPGPHILNNAAFRVDFVLIGTIDEVIICPATLTDQSITNAYKAGIANRRTTYAP